MRTLSSYKLTLLMLILGFSAVASWDEEEEECGCTGGVETGIVIEPRTVELAEKETANVKASTESGKSAGWEIEDLFRWITLSLSPSSGASTQITITSQDTFPTWVTSGVTTKVSYTPLTYKVTAAEYISDLNAKLLTDYLNINLLPAQIRFDMTRNEVPESVCDLIPSGTTAKVYVYAVDRQGSEFAFSGAVTGINQGAASVVGVQKFDATSAFLLVQVTSKKDGETFLVRATGTRSDGKQYFAYERFTIAGP
ncbi:MAG: hypothetical protein HY645_00885 [Acidobacteria bacterium]|nr:hypothetical protein [Acidobacteriota bacterium]